MFDFFHFLFFLTDERRVLTVFFSQLDKMCAQCKMPGADRCTYSTKRTLQHIHKKTKHRLTHTRKDYFLRPKKKKKKGDLALWSRCWDLCMGSLSSGLRGRARYFCCHENRFISHWGCPNYKTPTATWVHLYEPNIHQIGSDQSQITTWKLRQGIFLTLNVCSGFLFCFFLVLLTFLYAVFINDKICLISYREQK